MVPVTADAFSVMAWSACVAVKLAVPPTVTVPPCVMAPRVVVAVRLRPTPVANAMPVALVMLTSPVPLAVYGFTTPVDRQERCSAMVLVRRGGSEASCAADS